MKVNIGDKVELLQNWTSSSGKTYYRESKFNILDFSTIIGGAFQLIGINVIGCPVASQYDLDNYFILANATNSTPQVPPQKFKVGDKVQPLGNFSTCPECEIISTNSDPTFPYRLKPLDGSMQFNVKETEIELVNAAPAHLPLSQTNSVLRYTIPDSKYEIRMNPFVGTFSKSKKSCDCGSSKTYGENAGPELHSHWCSSLEGNK